MGTQLIGKSLEGEEGDSHLVLAVEFRQVPAERLLFHSFSREAFDVNGGLLCADVGDPEKKYAWHRSQREAPKYFAHGNIPQ